MGSHRITKESGTTGRAICRAIARFSMLVFSISALWYWSGLASGGCGYRSIETFTSVTFAVALSGIALLLIAIISAHLIHLLDYAFSKVANLSRHRRAQERLRP